MAGTPVHIRRMRTARLAAGRISTWFQGLPATVRGAAYMTGGAFAFTVMMVLVRHVSASIHPFEAAFFRNLFGLLPFLPWLMRVRSLAFRTRRFGLHAVRAGFGLTAMLLFFLALSLVPLAEATALTFATPLFATAGAALVLKERVGVRRWSATLAGFAGVLVILRPGAEVVSTGALAALGAAVFMALAVLCIKALSRTEAPASIVLFFGVLVTPLSLVPALLVWTTPSPAILGWCVLMGLAATAGQIMITRAFASADASAVLPFDFSRLVFVSVLGMVLFAEMPDVWTYLGAAVIIGATVYIARREARLGRRATPVALPPPHQPPL